MNSKVSKPDWLDGLAAEFKPRLSEPPPGYYSPSQAAEKLGVCKAHAGEILRKKFNAGLLDRVKIRGHQQYFYGKKAGKLPV